MQVSIIFHQIIMGLYGFHGDISNLDGSKSAAAREQPWQTQECRAPQAEQLALEPAFTVPQLNCRGAPGLLVTRTGADRLETMVYVGYIYTYYGL